MTFPTWPYAKCGVVAGGIVNQRYPLWLNRGMLLVLWLLMVTLGAVESDDPKDSSELLGAWTGESLPDSGDINSWAGTDPDHSALIPIGESKIMILEGLKYAQIQRKKGNGFTLGIFKEPIPCKGVSVVVAVRPSRCQGEAPWTSIVDVFNDRLALGIHNDSGLVGIRINGVMKNSEVAVSDGNFTILSLVVKPEGSYTVYANGTQIMAGRTNKNMNSLVPGVVSPSANAITVGRNVMDPWTTFNGLIGAVYIYKKALPLVERQRLEVELAKSFRVVLPLEDPGQMEKYRSGLMGLWRSESLPNSGTVASWPDIYSTNRPLMPIGETKVETIAGLRYAAISKEKSNGFSLGTFPKPIPCKGASIMVAVRPIRCLGKASWTSIVDVFYDRLTLGIHNDTGLVCMRANGIVSNSEKVLPDRSFAILSLVVKPDGTYAVYANGTQIITGKSDVKMTSLIPGVAGPYANAITIGRNAPDGWTTFNGYIGAVYLYTKALSQMERQQLEGMLAKSFREIPPVGDPAPKEEKNEP